MDVVRQQSYVWISEVFSASTIALVVAGVGDLAGKEGFRLLSFILSAFAAFVVAFSIYRLVKAWYSQATASVGRENQVRQQPAHSVLPEWMWPRSKTTQLNTGKAGLPAPQDIEVLSVDSNRWLWSLTPYLLWLCATSLPVAYTWYRAASQECKLPEFVFPMLGTVAVVVQAASLLSWGVKRGWGVKQEQ